MKEIGLKIVFAFIAITLNSVAYAGLFSRSCNLKEPIEKWNFCEGRAKYGAGVYEGFWKDGKPDGEGILEISLTNNFEGAFKEGKPVFGCEGINNNSAITLKFNDSYKEELTTNKKYFEEFTKLRKIKKINLEGDNIYIDLASLTLHEEYEAPTTKVTTTRNYENSAVTSVVRGVLTLGIRPLMDPQQAIRELVGCSELRNVSFKVNKSKGAKTNVKTVLEDHSLTSFNEEIEFTFLDKSIKKTIYFSKSNDGYKGKIDLVYMGDIYENLQSKTFDPSINLKVGCASCRTENNVDLNNWKVPDSFKKIQTSFEIDLNEKNKQLYTRRIEQEERDKEAARLEELEKQRIAREGDGSPDDTECQRRKLKPSSPAYVACMEKLPADREKQAAAEAKKEQQAADALQKRQQRERDKQEKREQLEQAKVEQQREQEAKREQLAQAKAERERAFTDKSGSLAGFSEAQNKCRELGFTPKTEGFGKCVLQLTK